MFRNQAKRLEKKLEERRRRKAERERSEEERWQIFQRECQHFNVKVEAGSQKSSQKQQIIPPDRYHITIPSDAHNRDEHNAYNHSGTGVKSDATISKSVDKNTGNPPSKKDSVEPGVSLRYGPADESGSSGSISKPTVNGDTNAKRKARSSIGASKNYREASSESEDDRPLVRQQRYS